MPEHSILSLPNCGAWIFEIVLKMIKLNWTKLNEIETLKTSIHLHWLIFGDSSLHDRVPHTYRLTSHMILYRVFSFSKILWAANVYSRAEKVLYELNILKLICSLPRICTNSFRIRQSAHILWVFVLPPLLWQDHIAHLPDSKQLSLN